MVSKKEFHKLNLKGKYQLLKKNGNYVSSRFFESYQVHLYAYSNYFLEVWCRIGLNQICWIELVKNQESLDSYIDEKKLLKELDLD